jgi:pimeloyl-ACP methyl ester carboxylesterase
MSFWFTGGDGQRLAADQYGPDERTPVLLIGGLGQTRHSWTRAAKRIAATGRRAITLDMRGHGESERAPDGRYGYPQQVGDIVAVVRAIGRPVVVAGNSLGGKIGLAAAGSAGPDVVAGLTMVDTVPRSRAEGIASVTGPMASPAEGFASPADAAAQVALGRGEPVTATLVERLQRNMRRDGSGRWHWHWDQRYLDPAQQIGSGAGSDMLEAFARRVRVPALLAWCELSEVVDAAGINALRAIMPQLEVEVIEGARHMIVGDQNDAFANALVAFLGRSGL